MKKVHRTSRVVRWSRGNSSGDAVARTRLIRGQRRVNIINTAISLGALVVSAFAVYVSKEQVVAALPKIVVRSEEFSRTIDSREGQPYAIGLFAPIIISNSGGRAATILRLEDDGDRPIQLLNAADPSMINALDIELSFGEYTSNVQELYFSQRVTPPILSLPLAIGAPLQPGAAKMYALRIVAKARTGHELNNPLLLFGAKLTFSDGTEHKLRYLVGGFHPLLEGTPLVGSDTGPSVSAASPAASAPTTSASAPAKSRSTF